MDVGQLDRDVRRLGRAPGIRLHRAAGMIAAALGADAPLHVLQRSLHIENHAIGGAVIFFMFGCGLLAMAALRRLAGRQAMFAALARLPLARRRWAHSLAPGAQADELSGIANCPTRDSFRLVAGEIYHREICHQERIA